ncbi:c-type cytochrome [Pseudorhodoferax sp.]|jgi:cytochrome c553|uniref:c-type cytochrome n=1 Tax=Pseudorhodoferax sp. TaxID=1993553 RepID=UPI001B4A0A19|nr:c-type cytochrome [Pseudorhodoferax sp.]MBP8145793.1 c-type cytochrome [Inhella sp.]
MPRFLPSALLAACLSSCLIGAALAGEPPPSGRLLASNCAQCHGTNGKGPGFDRLAGKSANSLYEELKEMQAGKEGDGLMQRHAMGYSDAQLRALAGYLSKQR